MLLLKLWRSITTNIKELLLEELAWIHLNLTPNVLVVLGKFSSEEILPVKF